MFNLIQKFWFSGNLMKAWLHACLQTWLSYSPGNSVAYFILWTTIFFSWIISIDRFSVDHINRTTVWFKMYLRLTCLSIQGDFKMLEENEKKKNCEIHAYKRDSKSSWKCALLYLYYTYPLLWLFHELLKCRHTSPLRQTLEFFEYQNLVEYIQQW